LSTGGTGHLLRHRKSCAHKADRVANSQSVLNYNSNGSVRNWDYNPYVARIEFCCLIARLDMPLGIGAYDVSDPSSTPEPLTLEPSLMFDSQSELLTYLDSDLVSEYDDDFNILSW
jgi:hypothetical protein